MGIEGVSDGPPTSASEPAAPESAVDDMLSIATVVVPTITTTLAAIPSGSEYSSGAQDEVGAENGECRLLGPFALFVQAGLGLLALSSLVLKRYRERPRRPLKIWFFDASKQVFGSVLLHVLNLLMSMFASGDFEISSQGKDLHDEQGRRPNPCSFYLINILVDVSCQSPRSCQVVLTFLRPPLE